MVDGNKLNSVLEFTYLGNTISSNGCIDDEIQRRMAKPSASFSVPLIQPYEEQCDIFLSQFPCKPT